MKSVDQDPLAIQWNDGCVILANLREGGVDFAECLLYTTSRNISLVVELR